MEKWFDIDLTDEARLSVGTGTPELTQRQIVLIYVLGSLILGMFLHIFCVYLLWETLSVLILSGLCFFAARNVLSVFLKSIIRLKNKLN